MTFISVVIAAASFLSSTGVLAQQQPSSGRIEVQYKTGQSVQLAQSGCNTLNKSSCPMLPAGIVTVTDGAILGPKGEVILKAREPIAIKGPDGQTLMVGKMSSCCSATIKTCCQTIDTDMTVVTIGKSGDLLDAKGRTIFKATEAYKIKGPGGEMIYEHVEAFVAKN